MDRQRVRRQILSVWTDIFGYGLDAARCAEWHRILNDAIAELCAARPQRFSWMASAPLVDAAAAARELERCVAGGAVGVIVSANVHGQNLGEAPLDEFWSACETLDAPVFVHPSLPQPMARAEKFSLNQTCAYTPGYHAGGRLDDHERRAGPFPRAPAAAFPRRRQPALPHRPFRPHARSRGRERHRGRGGGPRPAPICAGSSTTASCTAARRCCSSGTWWARSVSCWVATRRSRPATRTPWEPWRRPASTRPPSTSSPWPTPGGSTAWTEPVSRPVDSHDHMDQQGFNRELMEFLAASPTPFHAVRGMARRLADAGFEPRPETDAWALEPGGRYFTTRNDSSIIAWTVPAGASLPEERASHGGRAHGFTLSQGEAAARVPQERLPPVGRRGVRRGVAEPVVRPRPVPGGTGELSRPQRRPGRTASSTSSSRWR